MLNEKGLSFERLKSLVQVADRGGLSQAAPRNAIRQNLMGRQIRELESFFKAKLTRKEGKALVLNENGAALAGLSRQILAGIEDFKRQTAGRRRTYTIVSGGSLYDQLVASRLAHLRELKLEIHLNELFQERMFEALLQGEADAAVTWGRPPSSYKFREIPLGDFKYSLFGARKLVKGHHPENLFKQPFVVVKHRDLAADIQKRLQTEEVVYVDENLPAVRMVQSGHFVAILPRLYQELLPKKEFASVELDFLKHYTREVLFFWNPNVARQRAFSQSWIEGLAKKLVISN